MRQISIFISLLLLLLGANVHGQIINVDNFYKAEDLIEDGNFHKAIGLYQEMLKISPNNANLNFKIGFCYLNTATEKTKAISYLEFASKFISENYKAVDPKEENVPVEALYYLGQAYHVNYRFDDAERTFYELKKKVSAEDAEFLDRIDHELGWCQYARLLMKTPVEMTVSNLGQEINSPYTEHSPVISGDESLLIFTTKRKGTTGNSLTDDGQYFEDIYASNFVNGKFQKAKPISNNINTSGHEASIALSFDGSTIFIYRDDEGDGNIYMSHKKGNDWGVPEALPSVVNSKYRETHATMSFDKREIYFTSDRKGGFGGLDIYRVRKLPNGNWSRAQNLGPNINTKYDEEGPYLHPDGTSLFFSSQGHNSMGGFDIFISYINQDEDKWMKPENIGYPINTPDDDIYYVPSVDGRRAYYASYANNSLGYYDIFKIDLSESHVRNQTVIAGIAALSTGELLIDGIISISSMDDELIGVYTPDQDLKRFLAILPRGKMYKVLFESSNFDSFEKIIKVPEFAYDQSGKVVQFNDIVVGGDDPAKNLAVAIDNNKAETDLQANKDMGLTSDENSYSFIGGDSRLADANALGESYDNQSVYSVQEDGTQKNSDMANLKDGESGKYGKAGMYSETDDAGDYSDGKTIDSDAADGLGKDGFDADGKRYKNKKEGRIADGSGKSRIFYYLFGIIAVLIAGFLVVRRK